MGGGLDTKASIIPPRLGELPARTDYDTLLCSWIDQETAESAMLRRVTSEQWRELVERRVSRDCTGILFPSAICGKA